MTKTERQRQLDELRKMEAGEEIKRFQSPPLDEIGKLRELVGVER